MSYCIKKEPTPYVASIPFIDGNGKKKTYNAVSHFEAQLLKKVKNGFSPIILICGERRIGKSLLALFVAWKYCLFVSKEFDFRKHTFYDSIRAIKELKNMDHEPMLIDEAADILDPMEWFTKTQRALKSMINTQAYKGMVFIFISPFYVDVAAHIRRHFDFCLYVTARGRFKAYRYVKKFNATETKKCVLSYFLDDLGIRMSDLPKNLYEDYKTYSDGEKEKIREKREIAATDEINPLIKKMLKQERMQYAGF